MLTEIELETVDSIKNTKCPTAMGRVAVACSHAGEKQHASRSDFALVSSAIRSAALIARREACEHSKFQ